MDRNRETQAVALLERAGAATMSHPGGTLLAHLRRTADRLAGWGASPPLVLAGLCHAAYGTDGFDHPLLDRSDRARLASVITPTGEELVHLYGSCDRRFTYSRLAEGPCTFRDRFTGAISEPDPALVRQFMELTFANELDIIGVAPEAADDWQPLLDLFAACRHLVTAPAWDAYQQALDRRSSTALRPVSSDRRSAAQPGVGEPEPEQVE